MPEEEGIAQRTKLLNYAIIALILVGLSGFYFFRGGSGDSSRLIFHNEGYLTIQDSEGAAIDLYYDDLVSVEFYDRPGFGEPVTGDTVDDVREGVWHSDAFGEYTASVSTKIDCCVLLRTETAAYAINLESADTTKGIYEALLDVMDSGS